MQACSAAMTVLRLRSAQASAVTCRSRSLRLRPQNADRLFWVHGNHMGVPAVITDATGTELLVPHRLRPPRVPRPKPNARSSVADLYYNRYRDYDPTTGRYIQADPIGLDGGASPYSYAMNNPLRYTDPTGESSLFP